MAYAIFLVWITNKWQELDVADFREKTHRRVVVDLGNRDLITSHENLKAFDDGEIKVPAISVEKSTVNPSPIQVKTLPSFAVAEDLAHHLLDGRLGDGQISHGGLIKHGAADLGDFGARDLDT